MAIGSIDSFYVAGSLFKRFFRQPTLYESAYASGSLYRRLENFQAQASLYKRFQLTEAQRINRLAIQAAQARVAAAGIVATTSSRPVLNIRV